jgi:hypothetical protein
LDIFLQIIKAQQSLKFSILVNIKYFWVSSKKSQEESTVYLKASGAEKIEDVLFRLNLDVGSVHLLCPLLGREEGILASKFVTSVGRFSFLPEAFPMMRTAAKGREMAI